MSLLYGAMVGDGTFSTDSRFVVGCASFLLQLETLLKRTLPINGMRTLALWPNGIGVQEFAADGSVR